MSSRLSRVLVAPLLVTGTACGGAEDPDTAADGLAGETGELVVYAGRSQALVEAAVDRFREETGIDVEVTNPLDFPGYDEKIVSTRQASQLDEAVSTGLISLEGRDVLVGVMSFQFLGGSMGSVVGERVARLMLEGARRKLPVVLFTASGGARMQEGIFSLMQMAKTSHAAAQLDAARQLLILVLTDPTTGGVTASFAMLGDVIIAEPGALIGFAGPRVIEGTIKQKLPPGFQRAEFLVEKGFVDMVVPRGELRSTIGFLIDSSKGGTR